MLGILWCKPQLGEAWMGIAWSGRVRCGQVELRLQTAALRAQALSAALYGGQAWQASVGCVTAMQCAVRLGEVTVADGSTEGFGPPCCSLWRVAAVSFSVA
jgi:hypothetical protein